MGLREEVSGQVSTDTLYFITRWIIQLFQISGEDPAALIELMLVMDNLKNHNPNLLFQYSVDEAHESAFSIYYNLNNLEPAEQHCQRFVEAQQQRFSSPPAEFRCKAQLTGDTQPFQHAWQDYQAKLLKAELRDDPLQHALILKDQAWLMLRHNKDAKDIQNLLDRAIDILNSQPYVNHREMALAYWLKVYVLAQLGDYERGLDRLNKAYESTKIKQPPQLNNLLQTAHLYLLKSSGRYEEASALGNEIAYQSFYREPLTGHNDLPVLSISLEKVLQFSDYASMQQKNESLALQVENARLFRLLTVLLAVFTLVILSVTYLAYRNSKMQARTDGLTQLLNRQEGMRRLKLEAGRMRRRSDRICIAILDLDGFKQINDTHGHRTGDEVLKLLAGIMQKHLRQSDVAFRYGGEEFVIVYRNTTTAEASVSLENLRDKLQKYSGWETTDDTLSVNFSAGLVEFSDTDVNVLYAIDYADKMLYQAKRSGKGKTVAGVYSRSTPEDLTFNGV
ncbi:GGDEF domain-containing protein [Alteromonas aestuariivivens]|uniref:GGDEF domain-containing protein n=1 Tax=Alteromonas aestuariivivens TaxID=1938339 RepID=UPI0011C02E78|nr:GGDEF domain-containing protein [Alteromonas aestuariivivens]